jgi:enoyl-CoA hydratase
MPIMQPKIDKDRESMTVVHFEVRDRVGIITLDDPPANTYTHQMFRQMDQAILKARHDTDVDVILLTSKGEKFFCAGANIKMLEEADPNWKYYFCLHANETLSRLEQTPKLVIAGLRGHTVGGGLEIAMAADLRIGCRDSGRVGLPEINLGVLPGTGGTQRLLRIVGKSKAIEMMVQGNLISFEEAHDLGIVNMVLEPENFDEAVFSYAKQFTLPNKAAKAAGNIKRCVQSGGEMAFEYGLALERQLQKELFDSKDAKEGLNAYNTKRTPKFEGK